MHGRGVTRITINFRGAIITLLIIQYASELKNKTIKSLIIGLATLVKGKVFLYYHNNYAELRPVHKV